MDEAGVVKDVVLVVLTEVSYVSKVVVVEIVVVEYSSSCCFISM